MNNLSWLLYWADVAPNVATFIKVMFGVLFFASLIGLIFFVCSSSAYQKVKVWDEHMEIWKKALEAGDTKTRPPPSPYDPAYNLNGDDRAFASMHHLFRFIPYVSVISGMVWCSAFFIPSKDTIYLIASSEMGEQVVQSEEFGKIRRVINNWLDDYLDRGNNNRTEERQPR